MSGTLDKALYDLQWDRIVDAVRARCTGPLSERLETLPIAETFAEARGILREAAEAVELHRLDESLPLTGIRDIGPSLDRLSRGGALEGRDLRAIASTLGAARALRKFLARKRSDAPTLYASCSTDPSLDDLSEELLRAVEPDGTLSDSASPELARLRTEVANLRGRIVGRLEQLLLKHADIVQDRFHTLREGRYVIPIRTDAHERLPGIVHGTSGSGATVFVEPRAIVNHGNRLKMAQGELEREVARILGILSARVGEQLASVRAAVTALDRADLRHAAAKLASDLGGVVPELSEKPEMVLVEARHPMLVLDGIDVVENDLSIRSGRGLILSGPNAGGKTVALKVLGMAALMARAGLPIPASEGSRAGFFAPVLTDIGDEQSIQKNLSTFSAHVTNLVRVLTAAGDRSLVLLDEVATGTDPNEGTALACALIDSLLRAGAAVATTTHYERLKAMAVEDDRLENASVGFNVQDMEPTFRVRMGVPGSSSALAVARRFGMPDHVLERAEQHIPEQSRTFDALVRQLEERFDTLDTEREAIAAEHRAAEELRGEAELALERARARDEKKLTEESERLLKEIREARGELKEARKALRKRDQHDEKALREVREQLARIESKTKPSSGKASRIVPLEKGTPAEAEGLSIGLRVWVPRLRAEVDIVESPQRGRVRVAAGPVKLWVTVDEIRLLGEAPAPAPKPAPVPPAKREERPRGSDNTVDVRGMRVEEAITMTEAFLDRMFGRSEPVAYVLHGVGSGALRDAIREHLSTHADQYVSGLRPGSVEEGGERVTVVYLR